MSTSILKVLGASHSEETEDIIIANGKPKRLGGQPGLSQGRWLILSPILISAALLYLIVLNPDRFGTYHDDGIYVTTAKSIATGQGYRIISLPTEPAQTKYPPLYPFLLSLVWRVNSDFPQNLIPMLWLSIAASIGFLAIAWKYLVVCDYATPWQSTIAVALAAFNSWTIVLSTSVMSEMLYAMLSVTALYFAERLDRRTGWLASVGTGVICGLAFLTRTSGIAVVLALTAYLIARRSWKPLIGSIGVALLFVMGWITWSYLNRTQTVGVNVAYYTNYLQDVREVIGNIQSLNEASKLTVVMTILGKNLLGLIVVSIPLICSGGLSDISRGASHGVFVVMSLFVVLVMFMLIVSNIIRRISTRLQLLYLYLFFYLAIHLVTPYTTYDRYLIPLLPFLLLFFVSELSRLFSGVRNQLRSRQGFTNQLSGAVVGVATLAIVGVVLFGYLRGIQLQVSLIDRQAGEEEQIVRWMVSNTEVSDTIISFRDPVYFLRTGRKAARSVPTALIDGALFQSRQPTVEEELPAMRSIIKENHGRYLVVSLDYLDRLPSSFRDSFNEMISRDPASFIPVFESDSGRSTIYRIESSI